MTNHFQLACIHSGEYYILESRVSLSVGVSVSMMISGALLAAVNDLAFNIRGWVEKIIGWDNSWRFENQPHENKNYRQYFLVSVMFLC